MNERHLPCVICKEISRCVHKVYKGVTNTFFYLKELLKKGYAANGHDNRGWQPLHEAAYNGHAECVSLLTGSGEYFVNIGWSY